MTASRLTAATLGLALTAVGLTACSSATQPQTTSSTSASASQSSSRAELADLLPTRYANGINVASGVYAPMEYLDADGNFTGFDYDLSQAIGGLLGTKLTFQTQDFTSIIPSLQSGKHDIIMFGMNDTSQRQKVLDFVDYFHAGLAIIVAKGNPQSVSGLLSLCGKTVAVAKGTTQADFVKGQVTNCAVADSPPITALELPTEGDALLAVRSGKAVADVFDAAPAAYNAATAGGGKQFQVVIDPKYPSGFGAVPTGIGVLKKNADLTKALQAALKQLIQDGTYAHLLAKYDLSQYGVNSAELNGGK